VRCRKRRWKEKPYEREGITLEEERRKVRRLRESGKTWLQGVRWRSDRARLGREREAPTETENEGWFAELSYAAPLAMSVAPHE